MLKINKSSVFNAAKISLGCAAAIVISTLIGLKYSITAGLITVLSIQNTKRETLNIAVKRIVSFFAAIVISYISFKLLGYTTIGFAVYIFAFILVCGLLNSQSAIVPVSVLITHILAEQRFSVRVLANEFMILFIGAGVGFRRLDEYIRSAKETALANKQNTLVSVDNYDLLYLEMRSEQCVILHEMYKAVKEMNAAPEQVYIISGLLKKISEEYHESNNVNELIVETDRIILSMKEQKMPETRLEFENRAVLYSLLIRTREFLSIKNMFMQSRI